MSERRDLTFARLDEASRDVERLLQGHTTVGRWSLGQILNHLSRALTISLDAPASDSPPTREQEVVHRRFFSSDKFPEGRTPPPEIIPPESGLDTAVEAARFRDAVERFTTSPGPFATHPGLGPLTREEWDRFHRMHCAHHLSFAVPR